MSTARRLRLWELVVEHACGQPPALEHVGAAIITVAGVDAVAVAVTLTATPSETVYTSDEVAATMQDLTLTLVAGARVQVTPMHGGELSGMHRSAVVCRGLGQLTDHLHGLASSCWHVGRVTGSMAGRTRRTSCFSPVARRPRCVEAPPWTPAALTVQQEAPVRRLSVSSSDDGIGSDEGIYHNSAELGGHGTTPRLALAKQAAVAEPAAAVPMSHGRVAVAGGDLAYTAAGSGSPLLLVHGLGGSRRTWRHLIAPLAATHAVIAPDLPGHGESDPPAGDYSLGAHATALRDLLIALGHPRATVGGHSLGGGIVMQFAYQFPDRTDRLVLISSGGLGVELSPMLRAATLPGADVVTAGLGRLPVGVTRRALPVLSLLTGIAARQDASPLAEGLRQLGDRGQRHAFLRTARAVIDWRGQAVTAARQLGLLADIPILAAWGAADRTIPPHHHHELARRLPHAHAVAIPKAGHYPHETTPHELLPAMLSFLHDTAEFRYDEARWRQLLTKPSC